MNTTERKPLGVSAVMKKMMAMLTALMLLCAAPLWAMAEGGAQLTLQTGAPGEFEQLENDRMKARFPVINTSDDQTVKSFEMRVYAVDAQGRRIWGEGTYYYWTTQKEIAPGQSGRSAYVTLPDCSKAAKLYAAVSKVTCTDGTVAVVTDGDMNYQCWNAEWSK